VSFGSGSEATAAAAAELGCASCHADHQGRGALLARVDLRHCSRCHFRDFAAHPEFAAVRERAAEAPGLRFSHARHAAELVKQWGGAARDTCTRCHEPSPPTRDLEPISFERHCAACHAKGGSLGSLDPVSRADVVTLDDMMARGVPTAARPEEFAEFGERMSKTVVRHRDDWVLFNLAAARQQLDPRGFAAERSALEARLEELRRRAAMSTPPAGLALAELEKRETALASELSEIEARLRGAPASGAAAAGSVLGPVDAALRAAESATEEGLRADGEALRRLATGVRTAPRLPAGLAPAEHDARRAELLAALDTVASAAPELAGKAGELRRRLVAVSAGEQGSEMLARARDQRQRDLQRIRDEIGLRRAASESAPALFLPAEERGIADARRETERRLSVLRAAGALPAGADAGARERKAQALETLAGRCATCHVVDRGALARVAVNEEQMTRAQFAHEPHLLQAECTRCHREIERSEDAASLHLPAVEGCRSCHDGGGVRADCLLCHRYHAPVVSP
jgi:hypothetical protein